ncbi:MAG: type II toxin-antitoxin system Phd/YefM family antitoxin [Candidatus Sumerlaeota bacterium]|nr:type II toxin-antitoxin system Phd/YefM family antitoxin [Candidatus Sumerlaeota bacterium]
MKIAPVADVKARFSAYIKTSQKGPVVVTRNGRPVAMLLSCPDEAEMERLILAYSPKFQSMLRAAKRRIRQGQGIRHEDFWKEMEKA